MTSDEEDKYFKKRDAQKLADARREQQLAAIKAQEREGVREALQSSEKVAEEALELGFDSETARVLPLVPVIQMAWADGSVSDAERDQVRTFADRFGIQADTPADSFLTLLLDEKPSDLFFERVNRVITHLVDEEPDFWSDESIVSLARQVAEASGGFFGLTDPINADERDLLEEFAGIFGVDSRRADDLIQNGEE